MSASSVHPLTPPAALMSRSASSTDFDAFWPYSPAGPVNSMTTPIVVVHAAEPTRGVSETASARATAAVDVIRLMRPPSVVLLLMSLPWSGSDGVELVFHDAAVPAGSVALELEGIAARTPALSKNGREGRLIGAIETQPVDGENSREVTRVARAHNDACHPWAIEHMTDRDGTDADAVLVRNPFQCPQQFLE